jgi:hypothetical protein
VSSRSPAGGRLLAVERAEPSDVDNYHSLILGAVRLVDQAVHIVRIAREEHRWTDRF